MTLTEARNAIGEVVYYLPYRDCDFDAIEKGRIVGVNDYFVFVDYDAHDCLDAPAVKATRPEDLSFVLMLWPRAPVV